jgi:hypothetical protein
MKRKLTLTIDEEIVQRAKRYASESGRSLSELVERYLDKITNGSYAEESASVYGKKAAVEDEFVIPDWLYGIAGSVSADIDYVKDRDKIRGERYAKYLK